MIVEVAAGIYRLGDRFVNWWLVVDGDRATVIDAGLPAQWSQLPRALTEIGLRAESVEAVLVTHGHLDHLACVPQLREHCGATAYVPGGDQALAAEKPKLDLAMVRHSLNPAGLRTAAAYARQGIARAKPVRDALPVADGDVLDVPGKPRFIEAPGHTAGGGTYVLEDRSVVFSGDVLVTLDPFSGRTGPRTLPAFDNVDHQQALESLATVGATGAEVVLPGHGEPWTNGARQAAEAARARESLGDS